MNNNKKKKEEQENVRRKYHSFQHATIVEIKGTSNHTALIKKG